MSGKTIIVPEGVINPNTMTIIEIPAESQHESVFIANLTQPREQNMMDGGYLYNSNVEVPNRFRPRYESSAVDDRPQRDCTPETMDSSLFRNQEQCQTPYDSSYDSEGPMDPNDIFKPEYSSIDFGSSDMSEMPMKLTSKTSITSGNNASGSPTKTMVTKTKLINLSTVQRPWDYFQSSDWQPRNTVENVDTPGSYSDMRRYHDAQSSPVNDIDDFYSSIEDSVGSGPMRTSKFQQVMGAEMPRQLIMPMASPISGYSPGGMPVGMSPGRSYYKQPEIGSHDQKIISTIMMDESSGRASGNVTRSGGGSPQAIAGPSQRSPAQANNIGQLCAGSVCAGGTYCKSAAIMGLANQGATSPRTPRNITGPARRTSPGASPVGSVAYMQAVPPSVAVQQNATINVTQPRMALNTTQPRAAFNTTMNRPQPAMNMAMDRTRPAINTAMDRTRPAINMAMDRTRPTINMAMDRTRPVINTAMNRTRPTINTAMDRTGPALNTTIDRPRPTVYPTVTRTRAAVNAAMAPQTAQQHAACNRVCSGPEQMRQSTAGPAQQIGRVGRQPGTQPQGRANNIEAVLLSAERQERQMIQNDLERLQQERRRLFADPTMGDRRSSLPPQHLFGPNYREEPSGRNRRDPPRQPKQPWRL